jgi:hypothetical protein
MNVSTKLSTHPHVTQDFHLSPLAFNSILPCEKICQVQAWVFFKSLRLSALNIIPELRFVVLGVFKEKKSKYNPSRHIEPFDTKINRFDGRNLSQRPPFLLRPESGDSFLLSTKKNWKKEKNKIRYQNALSLKLRDRSPLT